MLNINDVNSVSMLLWQLVTGHSARLNPAMWYQSVLVCLTVLFFVIGKHASPRIRTVIFVGLAALSLIMQYSGFNYAFFNKFRYEVKDPLGRFVEMISYAALGILAMQYLAWVEKRKHRITALIVCAGMATGFLLLDCILPDVPGFQYSGLPTIGVTASVVLLVYMLPVYRLPTAVKEGITIISQNTLGIYCMHNMVGKFLTTELKSFGISMNGVCNV